ncbi:hypothetical protein D4764_13G0000320, partial [Takifugu flavidus]
MARIRGPDTLYSLRTLLMTPPRDTVKCLLQVHKTNVVWLGKLPCTLKDPAEGVELVHRSTPRTKTTLLLLNTSLKELWADLIYPRGLATEEFFVYLDNLSPGDTRACPQVPRPCFLTGRLIVHCFPYLRGQIVVQNLFEAVQKSFSMASLNSSHVRVFASATTVAALCLACRYLSAASGVPHATGSGIAAMTGTNHFVATAPVSRLNNGGMESGPLGLNVPRLPWDMAKALSEAKGGYLSSTGVVESPTPLEKTGSRALAMRRGCEPTGRGSHVASLGCDQLDSMGRGPAT